MKRVSKKRSKFLVWFISIWLAIGLAAIVIDQGFARQPESSPERKQTIAMSIDDELRELFIHHPMEEVSKKFWIEIATGKVKLEWNNMNEFFGSFGIHSQKETLKVNLPFIRNALRSEFGRKYLTIAIYHEAIHHRQYHDLGEKELGGSCETYWLVEQEAYRKHCLLAKRLGIHEQTPYCNLIDDEKFDQKLLMDLIASDPNFSVCNTGATVLQ